MNKNRMKAQIVKSLFFVGAGLGLTACVDNSYDLSKDIDMTVQLGTQGLQVKLGNTERIHLSSLLEIEEEEMIEQTSDSLYYLIEDGSTKFDFEVPNINADIDIATLSPDIKIFDYDELYPSNDGIRIPFKKGQVFTPDSIAKASHPFAFKQYDIPEEVVSIKRILPAEENRTFNLKLEMLSNENSSQDFVFQDLTNLKISLPSFIKSKKAPNGVITINKKNVNQKVVDLGTYDLDCFELEGDFGQKVLVDADGSRHIDITEDVHFEGLISLKANSNFEMGPGDFTNVKMSVRISGKPSIDQKHTEITLKEVTGVYDPKIDPAIDPIDISKDLPDFLDDEDVVMDVANPTIKFDINMQNIPTKINFFSDLTSFKDNKQTAAVRLPESGIGALNPNQNNTLYFFQGDKPFDPNGTTAAAQLFKVNNLSSLITKIPDEIRVDLSEGHIRLDQSILQTIELNKTYQSEANYNIYVPFQFNKGLKVVYKDSTDSFKDDLEDYQAKGAEVTATIISNIPLALKAKVIPINKLGHEITTIRVNDAQIPAAQNDGSETRTDITLTIHLDNPSDLQILDRLRFRIEAAAERNNGVLCSNQYLEVKDIRIKLLGPVIADFN